MSAPAFSAGMTPASAVLDDVHDHAVLDERDAVRVQRVHEHRAAVLRQMGEVVIDEPVILDGAVDPEALLRAGPVLVEYASSTHFS